MAYEISGKVVWFSPVKQVSSTFRVREFVIEQKETNKENVFFNYVKFQLNQDRCDLINESYMNEEVKVMFDVRGRKWERDNTVNYITNLNAWKIERLQVSEGRDVPSAKQFDNTPAPDISELDDLPF